MNVGIVTTWFERGAAYVSKQYMESLQENHEVFVYARGGESYAKGNPIWDFSNVKWGAKTLFQVNNSPINKRDFVKWIRNNNIDVLFFNEQQWWPPVLWAKKEGVRIGSYIDYYTEETIPLFELFDFLICNTKRHLSAFKWHPNAYYVPWGTNINLYKPGIKNEIDKEKIVFFASLGMNPERKGGAPLLRAFAKVKNKKSKLLVHTQINLSQFYPELKGLISQMKKEGRLEEVDETVSAPGLYHRGDVYCYLSKLDGIGLTLVEAASSGLQIITPSQPPMSEFVKNDVTGLLLKVSRQYSRSDGYYWPQCDVDEKSVIEAIEFYSAMSESEISKLKKISRDHALANFDWSTNDEKIDIIFSNTEKRLVCESLVQKVQTYEFKNTVLFDLIRLPYKAYKSVKR